MAICARRFQQAPLDGESGRPLETWVSLLESAKFDGDEQDGRAPSSASGDDALDDLRQILVQERLAAKPETIARATG